ncbi:MAG: TROVE domain-containing protein [Abitibacteriaceae bacterium]|nr:TROVE domain-containing protein [Abditibacteriaceae bacterium]
MSYLKKFKTAVAPGVNGATPQSEPIPGSAQVPNSAGGYAWAVDDWTRLHRFLVLGSEGGSYYAKESALTAENANPALRCMAQDGQRVVQTVIEISESGRAPKNDPALFVLALAASQGDVETRKAALAALPRVARTGTHLMHFAAFVDGQRGWGRGLRNAIGNWYNSKPARDVGYQALKYQQRDGWSHRDLLRLAHPHAPSESHQTIYHWITQGWEWVGPEPHPDFALQQIWAYERIKRASTALEAALLIMEYRLPREAVPTQFLNDPAVWEALLESMPMTALIRNLATLTRIGLLTPMSATTQRVREQVTNGEWLRKARVHPIAVLSALKTYAQGHGERGQHTWQPVPDVIDALDKAFYLSFGNVTPTNKRLVLALDVSGSMTCGAIAGVPGLTPRVASAAMALITAATESSYQIMGFSTKFMSLKITPRQRLDDALKVVDNLPFSGTDCALPMLWAKEQKVEADAFVVYTDSETWFGKTHPAQALRQYRDKTSIAARLVVVGMMANNFTIADPNDAGMLDVVGFDTATPQLISDFARGSL